MKITIETYSDAESEIVMEYMFKLRVLFPNVELNHQDTPEVKEEEQYRELKLWEDRREGDEIDSPDEGWTLWNKYDDLVQTPTSLPARRKIK